MASIPGIVFIIIGIIMSVVSFFRIESLKVFIYVGLLFVFWGLVKIIAKTLRSEKKRATEYEEEYYKSQKPQQRHAQTRYCPRCRSQIALHHNFCSKCGARV